MKLKNFFILLPSLGIILIAIGLWVVLGCKTYTFEDEPVPTGPEIGFVRLNIKRQVMTQDEYPNAFRLSGDCSTYTYGSTGGDIVSYSYKDLGGTTLSNDKKFLRIKTMCNGVEQTMYYADDQIKKDSYVDVPVSLTKKTTLGIYFLDKCCASVQRRLAWTNMTGDAGLTVLANEANLTTITSNFRERLIFLANSGTEQCF